MDNSLIKRQDAIDAVAKILSDREGGNAVWWKPVAKSVIDVLPSVQPEQRWIPCSERLPEDSDYHDLWETPDGAVLWCKATGEIGIGWYYESTKNWCDLWDNGVKDVIAWMPLPEPYDEDKQND